MNVQPGFVVVSETLARQMMSECELNGWKAFRLPDNVEGKSDFFSGARNIFPLDPPLVGSRSWDALADSLWEGLVQLPDSRIVILWPNSSKMERVSPSEYLIAESILRDLVGGLANTESTLGRVKEILVIQVK